MARWGGLVTVGVGKMPSSQVGFTAVIVTDNFDPEAIDGGAKSILNGGGNLRCYTKKPVDGGVQIPVEVVTFVTGGTPVVQVWVLHPELDVGDTVYIEADTVATSQPAFGAPFGRNSVYPVDAYLHLNANSYTDVTGNSRDGVANSSPVQSSSNHPFGGSWTLFDGINDYITLNNSIGVGTGTLEGTVSLIHRGVTSTNDGGLVCSWNTSSSSGSRMGLRVNTTRTKGTSGGGGFGTSDGILSPPDGTTTWLTLTWNATDIKIYRDGVQVGSKSLTPSEELGVTPLTIGSYYDFASNWCENAYMGEVLVSDVFTNAERAESTYNNQSDPASFWVTGAWEDQDAGGEVIEADAGSHAVTGTAVDLLASYVLAADAGSYAVTGAAAGLLAKYTADADPGVYLVAGQAAELLASYSTSADAGSYIVVGNDVTFADPSPSFFLSAEAGSYAVAGSGVTFGEPSASYVLAADAGSYTVTGNTAALVASFTTEAGADTYIVTGSDVTLKASYNVQATRGNYAVTGKAVTFTYSGDTAQIIGEVTATFKAVDISAQYLPAYTVSFKNTEG